VRKGDHEVRVLGTRGAHVVVDVVHAHLEASVASEQQQTERVRPTRHRNIDQ
jgi:hypothetical protein